MNKLVIGKLPPIAAIGLLAVIIAACTIHLRGDEKTSAASADQVPDPLATKLAECRSVTYEQKGALSECRKAWTERRRQFLKPTSPTSPERGTSQDASPLFVHPEDDSGPRLGPHNSIEQPGKD
jgi:conjugative transfer region protein TrbK